MYVHQIAAAPRMQASTFVCDVNVIICFFTSQDLMYFHKIAAALGMQCIVAVSSVNQMLAALRLPGIRAVSVNNRNMATWALDSSRVDRILGDPEGETSAWHLEQVRGIEDKSVAVKTSPWHFGQVHGISDEPMALKTMLPIFFCEVLRVRPVRPVHGFFCEVLRVRQTRDILVSCL